MRIKKECHNIDYQDIYNFFNRRAKKYNASNPYAVTMYQDDCPDLVRARNKMEIEKLMPLLKIDS